MASSQDEASGSRQSGVVPGPQSLVAGLALLALAAFAVWLGSDLPLGTLRAMGPGLLPRWLAYGVGLCGAALVVAGLLRPGEALERWTLRGPAMVCLAILAFALTIRPFPLGSVTSPGLGLAIAGPLSILVAGYASPEARLRELAILGLALTAFSMLLFGDLLNLPIPMVPQATTGLFPGGWSQKAILRVVALAMIAGAALLFLAGHARRGPIDVATHSVRP